MSMFKNQKLFVCVCCLVLIIMPMVCFTACGGDSATVELSGCIGKTLSEIENELDVDFQDMTQYFENTYRIDKRDGEFDCIIDEQGKVIRVHVLTSGKAGFAIYGVTTDIDETRASEILAQRGITHVRDSIWCCANGVDAVIKEEMGWSVEKASAILQEELLRSEAEAVFSYQYEDSLDAYYIGNGQIIECLYKSFPKFVYDYEGMTAYQRNEARANLDGRYVVVEGTVTGVGEDGTISVFCEDKAESNAEGLIWPMQGFANLYLRIEQREKIIGISKDMRIYAFGRLDVDSYSSLIGGECDLTDSILISVEGEKLDVPFIGEYIPGLTTYLPTQQGQKHEESVDVLSILREVLLGEREFINTENNSRQYIDDIDFICGTEFDRPLIPVSITALDVNWDNEKEVIVELTDNMDGWRVVLRYYEGEVYGYGFVFRGMSTVYCSGIFVGSSSAADSGRYKLYFKGRELFQVELEYDEYPQEDSVQWYDYTPQNIDYITDNQNSESAHINESTVSTEEAGTWDEDAMTGAFHHRESATYFEISAEKDLNGNLKYWLYYGTGGNTIDVPSESLVADEMGQSILFEFEPYYPEYKGNFEFRLESGEYYACADIPGLLDTSGVFICMEKL